MNGSFMNSGRPSLAAIKEQIRDHDRQGQLRCAVYNLLGRDDGQTEQLWRRYDIGESSSNEQDAQLLYDLLQYDAFSYFTFFFLRVRVGTDASKVLNGALMLIGHAAHDLTQQRLAAAERAAVASSGKLYYVLLTLFGDRPDEAADVCNRLKVQLRSSDRFTEDATTVAKLTSFPIDEYAPKTLVQGALALLGLAVYERAWTVKLEDPKQQATRPDTTCEMRADLAQEPRLVPPPTALLLVLQASKLHPIPGEGQAVTPDVLDDWLLGATHFACLLPSEADELECGLRLAAHPGPTGEEDIYLRVSLSPESAPRRITRLAIRQSLTTVGDASGRVLKVRKLDVRHSGDAMSRFEYL